MGKINKKAPANTKITFDDGQPQTVSKKNKNVPKNEVKGVSVDENAFKAPKLNNKGRKALKRQLAEAQRQEPVIKTEKPQKNLFKQEKQEKSAEPQKGAKKGKKFNKNDVKPVIKKFGKNDGGKKVKTENGQSPKTNGTMPGKVVNKKFVKKEKKPKIEAELVPSYEEAPPFNEDDFNEIVKQDKVKKIVKALTKLVKDETDKKKQSIFTDYRYMLNIACFKISSCPKRTVKLKLKHSIAEDDTVLIVRDLQRGLKVDYEPTIHHYQDLLKEHDIKGIKNIVSFNQLKKEYGTFEMKHKFANLYDYYLCDGAIVGHVVGFLGKSCSSKIRSTLYALRMQNPKTLKAEVKKALNKTGYKQGQKGNLTSIPVGTHTMTTGQVADNILHIVSQLKTVYAGGWPNILNMSLRINIKGTSALPLYINMGKPLEETPYIQGTREIQMNKLKTKANEILTNFEITNTAGLRKLTREEIVAKRKLIDEGENLTDSKKFAKKLKKEAKKLAKQNDEIKLKSTESSDEEENNDDDDDDADEQTKTNGVSNGKAVSPDDDEEEETDDDDESD